MGIICGARKSFLELGIHIMMCSEALDFQHEIRATDVSTVAL
jgi:hypothetical protein